MGTTVRREPAELAILKRALGRQLAAARQAAEIGQQEVAHKTGYSRSSVAHAEAGRQLLTRDFWTKADSLVKANGALIAGFERIQAVRQDHERTCREAELAEAQAATEEALRATTCRSRRGDADQPAAPQMLATRREIFGYVGAGVTAIGLEQVIAGWQMVLPRVVHALEATQQTGVSDSASLENLNTVVEHYKRTFRSTPPAGVYNAILGVRVHAGLLLDGTGAANNHPDLAVATGWLSNLLALVTHDLDDRAAALIWCADAERRSREAGYPELAGWAAETRAVMSFYDGQGRETVNHAQRGQTLAAFGTVAHAKLITQEMRAWALLGNSDKVSSTRLRAEQAIAKLPTNAPTQGRFSISLAEDPPCTGTSLLLLGRYKEAVEVTRRGIVTFYGSCVGEGRRENPSGFARACLILALALAGLGELDEAYAAASTALEAPRLVRSVAVLAGELDRKLMRDFTDTTEACAYHERYIAAMQQSPSLGDPPIPTPLSS
ncbi:MAG: helix-turn-helix domain-containing protein [Pseudonocardiaceae bacterium]